MFPFAVYLRWFAAALAIAVLVILLPRPRSAEPIDAEQPAVTGQVHLRDKKISRTARSFASLVTDAAQRPLHEVNREGLRIAINIDPAIFELMKHLVNRDTFKDRAVNAAVAFADRPAVATTISLRGGNSLRLEGKPNFDLHLMTGESFIAPAEGHAKEGFKRVFLMNFKADPQHVKMVFAYRVLRELGLFPLHFQYASVFVNGEAMGIYLLVEPPVPAIRKRHPNVVAIHRRQRPNVFTTEWSSAVPQSTVMLSRLRDLCYAERLDEPVDSLEEVIDLDAYFTWLCVNSVLRNLDTLDELFLFEERTVRAQPQRLRIIAWDYDDIFAAEARRESLVDKLIFSSMGSLDETIQKHPELYAAMRTKWRQLLSTTLTPARLQEMLEETAALRDSLDDGRDPAVQTMEREARARYVAQMQRLIADRHAELLRELQ